MQKVNTYQKWADVVKGIGIIAVVLGHSGNLSLNQYVYWFHMPLFFIMSGYFFKPIENSKQFPSLLKKYSLRLLVPYLSFLATITIIRYAFRFLEGRLNPQWIIKDLSNLLIGGRLIGGWYGPFWFITTLFFTYIAFAAILLFIKKDTNRIILIGILYLVAHCESWVNLNYNFIVPLNLDVTLIAITYFAFGYYSNRILSNITKPFFIASSLVTLVLYISSFLGVFNYSFNMKNLGYHNILIDFIAPIAITVTIMGLSQLISNYKTSDILVYLGKLSLPIMYLHILPNGILQPILGYGTIIYTIIGISFPLFVTHFILHQFKLTKILFLGKNPSNFRESLSK